MKTSFKVQLARSKHFDHMTHYILYPDGSRVWLSLAGMLVAENLWNTLEPEDLPRACVRALKAEHYSCTKDLITLLAIEALEDPNVQSL